MSVPVLSAGVLCVSLVAQAPVDPAAANPANPAIAAPPAADAGPVVLEWIPPAMAQLSTQAAAKSSFTLDRNMLAAAVNLMSNPDDATRQAIAKLDGVSVHMLNFSAPHEADPAQIDAVRDAYHLRGWKHLVSSGGAGGPVHSGMADVWLVLDGTNVRGAVVLVNSPKSLMLVTLAGNLNPVDLLHLRGHFGIPRFDGDGLRDSHMN